MRHRNSPIGGMTAQETAVVAGRSVHVVRHELRLSQAMDAPRTRPLNGRAFSSGSTNHDAVGSNPKLLGSSGPSATAGDPLYNRLVRIGANGENVLSRRHLVHAPKLPTHGVQIARQSWFLYCSRQVFLT